MELMLERQLSRQLKLVKVLRVRLARARSDAKCAVEALAPATAAAESSCSLLDTIDLAHGALCTFAVTHAAVSQARLQDARKQQMSAQHLVLKVEERIEQVERRMRAVESRLQRAAEERRLEAHLAPHMSQR